MFNVDLQYSWIAHYETMSDSDLISWHDFLGGSDIASDERFAALQTVILDRGLFPVDMTYVY